ncbi:hypothetical protein CONLIGDRAFT_324718 [Coniochaeta ligniaria NRRL 30616]|uniref:Uncharacterized protein n=1 Tax=Coniochaeta ligniaria NRRL 30616 TaxID=1408157 RepID=A0A1J7IPW6_9PEZI|nr:hypothetical protein CONLIGDRAFT_324718 [Coniochaeta ligniaria NRRL 30616]
MAVTGLKLVRIDYDEVKQATADTSQRVFNTCFHTLEEAPDLIQPSEGPYSFKRWLKLILSTRNVDLSAVQTITLSRPQTRLLLDTADGSLQTWTVNRMFAEDIDEEIKPILRKQLTFPPEGLFLRLDACSPKDGAHLVPGKVAFHTVEEVILRLVTSHRARNSLFNSLKNGHDSFDLFFMPFDARMRSELEYRVFCPPGAKKITAISQYQWHKPWRFAGRDSHSQDRMAQTILDEVARIHRLICEDLHDNDPMDELLIKQGFSFDVFFDEDSETCQLVELNGFGVRSSCGSCLFHWVKDRDQLYGSSNDIEFRVTL